MSWTNLHPITFAAGNSLTIDPSITSFTLYSSAAPPMSRKKARKAWTAAEEAHAAAVKAITQAERDLAQHRRDRDAARKRMDEAARILASDK
jgi:hypothetical protein